MKYEIVLQIWWCIRALILKIISDFMAFLNFRDWRGYRIVIVQFMSLRFMHHLMQNKDTRSLVWFPAKWKHSCHPVLSQITPIIPLPNQSKQLGRCHIILYFCFMITSSNENIFRVTGPLCGEFTGHWWIPLTKDSGGFFYIFFDLRLNKELTKQSKRPWFETSSRSLWRHCNFESHRSCFRCAG